MMIGDPVEIIEHHPFSPTTYRLMIVRHVEREKFTAELVKGHFGDDPKMTLRAFHMNDRGRNWR